MDDEEAIRYPAGVPRLYQPRIAPRPVGRLVDPDALDWRGGLLVRAPNWLGDALMSLPALHRLVARVPAGGKTTILTHANLADLWRAVDWVDRVIPMAARRTSETERQAIRAAGPGLSLILPNSFGSALDVFLAGVPHRVGRTGRGRRLLLHHALPAWHRVAGRDEHHEVSKYLELVAACGAAVESLETPPLRSGLTEREQAAVAAWADWPRPLLVLAPGAAFGPAKQWPAAAFHEVAAWWRQARGGTVVAVGAAKERAAAAAAVADIDGTREVAGQTSLSQLIHLLGEAAGVVANDSGVMHLAAALHRPGVAVFGSTDPVATGPLGGRWIVLQERLPCVPCLQRTCPRQDVPYECLHAIAPSQVIAALETLLPTRSPDLSRS